MGTLCYTLVDSETDTRGFDCGNTSINELVSSSVFPSILKQVKTYKMSIRAKRIGFFSVSIRGISFEDSDASIASYYEKAPTFGAVMIDFIAVEKKVQKRGIGTTALEYVVQAAKELSAHWPVRVLVLDALRDTIDWYTQKGFAPINTVDLASDSPVVRLYIDLMTEEEQTKLDQHIQNSIDY